MTQISQQEKGERFRSLHEQHQLFVMPNPWDAGSARLLTNLGFAALATTSAGLAFSLGKTDGTRAVSRQDTLKNARNICAATHLPVSADLENGYGDKPEYCAETILMAAEAGLVGGSIEDATGNETEPIYPFELAVARVKAASEAARQLPFRFTLTARAENMLHGIDDLDDSIRRLVAYAEAGADVLFAPGLQNLAQIEAVVKAILPKPVNMLVGIGNTSFSVAELQALRIRRISTGSSLRRAAYSSFFRAAKEIADNGTFGFNAGTFAGAELDKFAMG